MGEFSTLHAVTGKYWRVIHIAKWVLIGDFWQWVLYTGWLGCSDAWLQLETNDIELLSAMLSFIEWIAFFIHSMLSSGRQAALAMHEACSNLMISEILNFRTTVGREGAFFVFVFLFFFFLFFCGFFLEGNFPFVNQLGNVVF